MKASRIEELQKRIAELESELEKSQRWQEETKGLDLFAKQMVETVREPLLILSNELEVLAANPSFFNTFETNPEDTEGKKVYEIGNHQWDIPRLRELLEDVLPENKTFESFEVDHDFPDIGRKIMAVNARQLDAVPMILVAIEDVTERELAQQTLERERDGLEEKVKERTVELERAVTDLEELNVELDGFAGNVSHDLRGSMAVIQGASVALHELLMLPESERRLSDIDEVRETIVKGVEKAQRLIADLLSLAEAGQVPKEVSYVDVGEVVSRVVDELSEGHGEKDFRFEVDDGLGGLKASPTHIYQLFWNLMSNAIVHNDNPRPVVKIRYLGLDEIGGHRYQVRDNGSGVPPGDLDKIFIPFFKGEEGETGIGLATVEKIIKTYGGSIDVHNDNGACFDFTIRDYTQDS